MNGESQRKTVETVFDFEYRKLKNISFKTQLK